MGLKMVDVAAFKFQDEAEAAIEQLLKSGFTRDKLTIEERDPDQHIVIVHGCAEEAIRAREIINRSNPATLKDQQPMPDKGNIARWEGRLLP